MDDREWFFICKEREEEMKPIKQAVEKVMPKLERNCLHGTYFNFVEEYWCMYCGEESISYNCRKDVIHKEDCPITILKSFIRSGTDGV